jgi:hypothetical protein
MEQLESLFFLFTTAADAETWKIFYQYQPGDQATLGEIRDRINQRIDKILKDKVPPDHRFYFRHTRQGHYSLPADAIPSWESVKGIIVDLGRTGSHPEQIATIAKSLVELAKHALPLARKHTGILSCFIPSDADPPDVAFKLPVIKFRSPGDSSQLEQAITGWLTDVSFVVFRARTGEDPELHDMADEYVETSLLKRAKAKH